MESEKKRKSLSLYLKKELVTFRKKGFFPAIIGITKRLRQATGHSHVKLWKYFYTPGQTNRLAPKIDDIEVKDIKITDHEEIIELAEKDEWNLDERLILKDLENGHKCSIVKHKGQIVACNYYTTKNEIDERIWARKFKLSKKEAYFWHGWCIPEYRGKGIMPFLLMSNIITCAKISNKTEVMGWTRLSNKNMESTLHKVGFTEVGRIGYFEFCGIRLSYIRGWNAFRGTKKRIYLHIPALQMSTRNLRYPGE